jgi:hypothetical protein
MQVNAELQAQLAVLPTGATAREAVKKGFAVAVREPHASELCADIAKR